MSLRRGLVTKWFVVVGPCEQREKKKEGRGRKKLLDLNLKLLKKQQPLRQPRVFKESELACLLYVIRKTFPDCRFLFACMLIITGLRLLVQMQIFCK